MATIIDCAITHTNAEVLKEYGLVSDITVYHTGIDIKASEIYAPCRGVIIQACKFEGKWSAVLQYSQHISLRFTNFKELNVHAGEIISTNQILGIADEYIHFEYLTTEENNPSYVVRIPPNCILWKHDPRLVLDKNIIFDESDIPGPELVLWGETLDELSNNKG